VTSWKRIDATDCDFAFNTAPALRGDGIVDGQCSLSVTHCEFSDNGVAEGAGSSVVGVGCPVTIEGSTFTGNRSRDRGGAIYYYDGLERASSVSNSRFEDNSSQNSGGAIHVEWGALVLRNDEFVGNSSTTGGALFSGGGGSLLILDTRFAGNSAADSGGALTLHEGPVEIASTSFEQNSAQAAGAIFFDGDGTLDLTNVTVAGNIATGDEAVLDVRGSIAVRNSIWWGNQPADLVLTTALTSEDPLVQNLFFSNVSGTYPSLIAFDPKFADPAAGDFSLSADSPCIDHADDATAPLTDLRGNPRVNQHETAPCPTCTSIADMGAYEFGDATSSQPE
jgi:hypothetical protein